jgi:multicomponent K+:H+ antiporter subunit F
MIETAITWSIGGIGLALLMNLLRLLRGPAADDRILALDTLYINTIALLVLFGLRYPGALLFEAAMLIAMLGFVSSVVLARFVVRPDIIE